MNNKMLTNNEYEIITKKILYNHFKNNVSLADKIYFDDIRFGTIVNAVMTADWEWDGKTGTIYGYRKQRAKWAIYSIIKKMLNNDTIKNKTTAFSQFNNNDFYIKNKKDFVEEIDQEDYVNYVKQKIDESKILSYNEKYVFIGKILQGKTIREMSDELGIRGEALRQALNQAVEKMGQSLCI